MKEWHNSVTDSLSIQSSRCANQNLDGFLLGRPELRVAYCCRLPLSEFVPHLWVSHPLGVIALHGIGDGFKHLLFVFS